MIHNNLSYSYCSNENVSFNINLEKNIDCQNIEKILQNLYIYNNNLHLNNNYNRNIIELIKTIEIIK